jgi:indole-3-glycerol phosphate synthase
MSHETFLARIVAHKREEIAGSKQRLPLAELEKLAHAQIAPRDLRGALTAGESIAVIAEMKKASPSAGLLREDFTPRSLAQSYAAHGAAALSVLTDEAFFQGSLEHLRAARAACALPVLRKDFLLDPYQVWEARALGADAVLFIVAILDRHLLSNLHDEMEIEIALQAGADLIGINNRDLRTFAVNLATTEKLVKLIPQSCVRVAESGISSQENVKRLAACGVDAILVGSHLMRQPNPGQALQELIGVPRR